ncbi:hypothetical protein ACLOJK_022021 [Asimina triloba]
MEEACWTGRWSLAGSGRRGGRTSLSRRRARMEVVLVRGGRTGGGCHDRICRRWRTPAVGSAVKEVGRCDGRLRLAVGVFAGKPIAGSHGCRLEEDDGAPNPVLRRCAEACVHAL